MSVRPSVRPSVCLSVPVLACVKGRLGDDARGAAVLDVEAGRLETVPGKQGSGRGHTGARQGGVKRSDMGRREVRQIVQGYL